MGNQFIGTATECLPLTGGTVSGSLNVSGTLTISSASELIMDLGSVTGGWARGLTYKLSNNITAEIGVYGTGNSVTRAFMGIGASPWTGTNALTVTASDVQYNGVSLARINGSYPNMTVGNATNATNASNATYATSAGSATNATNATNSTNATVLSVNNTEAKNLGRLQYLQGSGNATLYPDTSWWSLIRAQHAGYANGYWQELALGFTNSTTNKGIKYRTNENGTLSAWKDVALLDQTDGYWGFYFPENNTYFRTPPSGLLPNTSSSAGIGYVGTSAWPFVAMYAKNFYGNLQGNATSATTATSATNATNATNASNLAYFKCTSSTNVGVDDVTANAIGYVSGIGLLGKSDGGLFKQVYSSVWAGEIFIDYRTGNLATRGKNNGTWTAWNNIVRNTINSIPQPIGGEYITNAQYTTGALQIKLPVGYTSSMLRFTVDIFDYATNQSCTYNIAGYNYGSNSNWANCSAYSHGYFNSNTSNLTVSFCKTGTTPCVCIGAVDTRWDYVQVKVRDVFVGYSGYTYAFQQGWGISFVTTMPTVQATVTNPSNWYNAYNAVTAGSATNASQLGGVAAANYINTSDTLILRGTV